MTETSWENSSAWYDKTVGNKGHYYHQTVIIPGVLRLLNLQENDSLLDLACGQGVLSRAIHPKLPYLGIDASTSLIKQAKGRSSFHQFQVGDVTQKLNLKNQKFSCVTVILAIQNIESPELVFKNASQALEEKGRLLIVLNHPTFRIARQSSWGVDQDKKLQYRRVDRYLNPLKIPIQTHPGKQENSAMTWSFHHPLSTYSKWLKESGFVIELIEEWVSDKKSSGPLARMENRSREEFPLFLTLLAKKI